MVKKKETAKTTPTLTKKKPTVKDSISNLENQKVLAQMEGDTTTVKLIDKIIKRLLSGEEKP